MKDYLEVYSFIKAVRGNYRFELSPSMKLEKDLKITGDDAYEFFDAYSSTFNVNIEMFDVSKYFATEGSLRMYMFIFFGIATGKCILTIDDLRKGIDAGSLAPSR